MDFEFVEILFDAANQKMAFGVGRRTCFAAGNDDDGVGEGLLGGFVCNCAANLAGGLRRRGVASKRVLKIQVRMVCLPLVV